MLFGQAQEEHAEIQDQDKTEGGSEEADSVTADAELCVGRTVRLLTAIMTAIII